MWFQQMPEKTAPALPQVTKFLPTLTPVENSMIEAGARALDLSRERLFEHALSQVLNLLDEKPQWLIARDREELSEQPLRWYVHCASEIAEPVRAKASRFGLPLEEIAVSAVFLLLRNQQAAVPQGHPLKALALIRPPSYRGQPDGGEKEIVSVLTQLVDAHQQALRALDSQDRKAGRSPLLDGRWFIVQRARALLGLPPLKVPKD